ncbi:MAG: Rieske (2Fe-2S) protein [Actinobacteria bacterium]|nr:Rieske (2Fe-2S) protein [Actinomycetota bacterium]
MSGDRTSFPVCRADELAAGARRIVSAGGVEVGVFNLGDRLVAYRNHCPHQGAPVCQGRVGGTTLPSAPGEYVFGLRGRVLHCPWHGWEFDLETGNALFGHRVRLAPVDVEVEDGVIVLSIRARDSR